MAEKTHVVLHADGGDMTVGRRIPVYVLGAFDVQLPEGREQVKQDGRVRNGYIYRPPTPAAGSLDVGFVKADARLDLGAKTSSLERVVDAAIKRTEGDVFFERDISRGGLGDYRPGVDFRLGDVVSVDVWGKKLPLPVTALDYEGSTDKGAYGVRVHVGGQMITDAQALQEKTDVVLARIEQEKRQRLKDVSQVSRVAHDAKTEARDAKADAAQADGKAELSLEKWREQKDATDVLQSQQIEANKKAVEVQKEVNATFERRRTRVLAFDKDGGANEWVSILVGESLTVTALGEWTGVVTVSFRVNALAVYSVNHAFEVTPSSRQLKINVGPYESPGGGFALIMPN